MLTQVSKQRQVLSVVACRCVALGKKIYMYACMLTKMSKQRLMLPTAACQCVALGNKIYVCLYAYTDKQAAAGAFSCSLPVRGPWHYLIEQCLDILFFGIELHGN